MGKDEKLCNVLGLSSQMGWGWHPLFKGFFFQLHGKTYSASESGGELLREVKETAFCRGNTYFRRYFRHILDCLHGLPTTAQSDAES